MKKYILLLFSFILFVNCVPEGYYDNIEKQTVNLKININLSSALKLSDKSSKGALFSNKFSEFNHIFNDEIEILFTSLTTDFQTSLKINPNNLENSTTILVAYDGYEWSIVSEELAPLDWYKSYIPIYGTGVFEVNSSQVNLDLEVDTSFGLVTVEKDNVTSAKISSIYADGTQIEKALFAKSNYFYVYVTGSDYENTLTVNESLFGTSISTIVGNSNQSYPKLVYPKTHYNYRLDFSEVSISSIAIKPANFIQYDYNLQLSVPSPLISFTSHYKSLNLLNGVTNITFGEDSTPGPISSDDCDWIPLFKDNSGNTAVSFNYKSNSLLIGHGAMVYDDKMDEISNNNLKFLNNFYGDPKSILIAVTRPESRYSQFINALKGLGHSVTFVRLPEGGDISINGFPDFILDNLNEYQGLFYDFLGRPSEQIISNLREFVDNPLKKSVVAGVGWVWASYTSNYENEPFPTNLILNNTGANFNTWNGNGYVVDHTSFVTYPNTIGENYECE